MRAVYLGLARVNGIFSKFVCVLLWMFYGGELVHTPLGSELYVVAMEQAVVDICVLAWY